MLKPYFHGDKSRVKVGKGVSLVNTLFNTASGNIFIENNVIFGHNCMVLTGIHEFAAGKRKRLSINEPDTPSEGQDIIIREGCWIASGSIILGGVEIGEHSIVAAGAVVTKSFPKGSMIGGVPAKLIKKIDEKGG